MAPIIASIVSGLISNGLPKIADAVIEKGVDYVEGKLGVTLKPEDEMKPEDVKDLRERAMQHKEFMAELEAKDRASARDREIQISTNDKAPLINKVVTPVLALGVVSLAFVLFGVLLFIDVKPEAKDILIYVLGVLSAAVTQILSYYFGSSQGSKDKNELLKEQQK
jgi:energy-converting hydrogenase Eha subunit A